MDIALVTQLGFIGIASYGSVAAVGLFKKDLSSGEKFSLLVAFAFVYAFIPADLGNEIANRIKDAIGIATTITTGNVVVNKLSGK